MATKSCLIGPTREENGNQVVTFGFTYAELTMLSHSIDEHIDYWQMWATDEREDVVNDALNEIDKLNQLQHKIDAYRAHALRNREDDNQ
jgi:murein L,D-transpeptidase YafK